MTEFPKIIERGGFVLRKIQPTFDVARDIYDCFAADVDGANFWMPNAKYENPEQVFINYNRRLLQKSTCLYGIYENEKLLGEIGFVSTIGRCGHLGMWLKKDCRGRGIIATLMPEIMRVGFNDMDMVSLIIECDSENVRSRRLAERFDFHLDGVVRGFGVWNDGSIRNKCVYSKLKSEWEKENKNA